MTSGYDGADHRADETGRLTGLVEADRLAAVGGQQQIADAEQDGRRVQPMLSSPGFQKACNETNDQSDDDGSD